MTDHLGLGPVQAMMFFCADPRATAHWWADLLHTPVYEQDGFCWIELIDGTEIGFHPEDVLNNPPGSSTVAYLLCTDLDITIEAIRAAGGSLHRGPLVIDSTRRIAQVQDPFGTVVGLDERRDA